MFVYACALPLILSKAKGNAGNILTHFYELDGIEIFVRITNNAEEK